MPSFDAPTAPAGRVYGIYPKVSPTISLTWARGRYAAVEGVEASWARCNPLDLDRFAPLWPGAVSADRRVLKGQVMLGRETL